MQYSDPKNKNDNSTYHDPINWMKTNNKEGLLVTNLTSETSIPGNPKILISRNFPSSKKDSATPELTEEEKKLPENERREIIKNKQEEATSREINTLLHLIDLSKKRKVIRVDLDSEQHTKESLQSLKEKALRETPFYYDIENNSVEGNENMEDLELMGVKIKYEKDSLNRGIKGDPAKFDVIRPKNAFSDQIQNANQLFTAFTKFINIFENEGCDVMWVNCKQGLSRSLTFAILFKTYLELSGNETEKEIEEILQKVTTETMIQRFPSGVSALDDRYIGMLIHILAPNDSYIEKAFEKEGSLLSFLKNYKLIDKNEITKDEFKGILKNQQQIYIGGLEELSKTKLLKAGKSCITGLTEENDNLPLASRFSTYLPTSKNNLTEEPIDHSSSEIKR